MTAPFDGQKQRNALTAVEQAIKARAAGNMDRTLANARKAEDLDQIGIYAGLTEAIAVGRAVAGPARPAPPGPSTLCSTPSIPMAESPGLPETTGLLQLGSSLPGWVCSLPSSWFRTAGGTRTRLSSQPQTGRIRPPRTSPAPRVTTATATSRGGPSTRTSPRSRGWCVATSSRGETSSTSRTGTMDEPTRPASPFSRARCHPPSTQRSTETQRFPMPISRRSSTPWQS